jgi:tetratricopeptide (TPR) repeat protein/transcriptional regulator with XRE-family HTH domain
VADQGPVTFGGLLRRLRTEAGLTQEELAEAAGVSARAVSDLERGINLTARKDTARLLADALGLNGPARAEFEASARGQPVPGQAGAGGAVALATRTLPRDIGSFTGRQQELEHLAEAAAGTGGVVGIHAIGGMAGVGKTAFAVHAAHRLADRFPGGQIFLPLHGHTPGQQPVEPADALASLLLTLGVPAAQIPPGLEARMALWRDRLAGRQLLLILDDAASSEQVRPLLPGAGGSLVLVTSRRHLTALDDVRAVSLDTLPPSEAAALLVHLAGQYLLAEPAQGRYRMHDLIREHARALADRLDSDGARDGATARLLDYYQHTVTIADTFITRYTRPAPAPAEGEIPAAVPAMADSEQALAWARAERASLLACLDLATDTGQYVRVINLTAGLAGLWRRDGPWSDAIIRHTAAIQAARHLGDRLGQAGALHDLGDVRQLTSDYPAATQAQEQALGIYRDLGDRLGQANALCELGGLRWATGEYPAATELLQQALGSFRDLGDRLGQANALRELGVVWWLTGEYRAAAQALEQALGIFRDLGDRLGQAIALYYLGVVRRATGVYPAAAQALEQALGIFRDLGDRLGQANALCYLGLVWRMTGEYSAAARALDQALAISRDLGSRRGQANALSYLGDVRLATGDYRAAAQALDQSLAISRDLGDRGGEAEVLNKQGVLHRVSGNVAQAEEYHQQALGLARAIGGSWDEAHALAGLGRCAMTVGHVTQAEVLLRQAFEIFQRIGAAEAADLAAELEALADARPTK